MEEMKTDSDVQQQVDTLPHSIHRGARLQRVVGKLYRDLSASDHASWDNKAKERVKKKKEGCPEDVYRYVTTHIGELQALTITSL